MDTARTKRFMLAELFIFLTLAGTTALLFQPLMTVINKNIDIVRERLITQAESILNRPIRYRSMDPSLIGTIEIRTLTVGDKDNPLVASERLFIEYSMWDLIRGKALGSVRTLILENPVFSYDRDRDGDIRRLFSGGHNNDFELPPACVVIVRNGSMALSRGKTVFSANGISLEGEISEDFITLNGAWQKNRLLDEAVTMEGSVSGSFSRDFTQGNAALSIDSIEAEGFIVDRIGFNLSFFQDRIIFERENDGLPLALSAVYLHDTGDFSVSFQADRFIPNSMIHLMGSTEHYAPLLAFSLSGTAGVNLANNDAAVSTEPGGTDFVQELSYRLAISGTEDAAYGGSPIQGFAVEAQGDGRSAVINRLTVNARRGFARYAGDIHFNPARAGGNLVFSDFSLTGTSGVNGTVFFGRTGRGLNFDSPALSFGDTVLSSLDGTIFPQESQPRYIFNFDCYRENDGSPLRSSFESSGNFQVQPLSLSGTAALRELYAADMIALARPFAALPEGGAVAEKTRISAEIAYEAGLSGINYRSYLFRAEHESGTVLSVSVSGNENRLALTEGTVQREQNRLDFEFNADFSEPEDLMFRCSLGYLDFEYDFEGNLRNRSVFTLRSNHDFSAVVQKEDERWAGSASGRNIPIPGPGRNASMSLDTVFAYDSADSWNFSVNQFEIRESGGGAAVSVRGRANQNGMNLDRIYYTDGAGPLDGSAAAVWNSDFSVIDGSFFLAGADETEKLSGDIFYEPGNLEFHGTVNSFNGERAGAAVGSDLRFSGEVYGGRSSGGYYLVNLNVTSLTGTIGGSALVMSGQALLDPERLILSQIQCGAGAVQGTIPYVSIDRNAGRLETEAMISGVVNEQELGVLLSLGMNFNPLKNWVDTKSLDSFSGILDVRYAYINQKETTEPFSFAFSRTPLRESGEQDEPPGGTSPGVYRVSGGPQNMLYAEFREDSPGNGIFSLSLTNPSPVQCFVTGVLDGTTIDALATEVFVDLGGLWETIPISKIVNFTGGTVTGEARMFGSIFDPEFEGTAWASGVTLTVPDYVTEEIGPVSGILNLEGNGFSFGPIDVLCGDGRSIVSGSLGFTRWMTNLDMTIDVVRNIPFDFNLLGIMANGSARGRLNILMEEEALITLTGDIEVDDTELTIDQAEIENSMSGENRSTEAEIAADVRITTGRRVEFLWPNASTPLLRAYGESRAGVRIMADTRIPQFTLDGNVVLRGGELYHLQRSFYIRDGVLQFNGNDLTFNPLITARAEVRDNNDDGPVIITMIMENVPLMELEHTIPRYQSTPSLSQVEIYSILGQAPSAGTSISSENLNPLLSSTTEMILQTVIFRRAEQIIRNVLGLDMFSFRTQILQNAVFEALRNREPDEQPATMGNYLDNTTVFIGKYIGQDLFFQGILSFRYDQYQEEFGGMRFEPEIAFDLRTPLFDVRWNLQPTYRESLLQRFRETLFVADQSVSLLWRWSL